MQLNIPTIACEVAQIEQLNAHVYRVFLKPLEPFVFKAGQYLEIILPTGQMSAFSMANAPGQEYLELHIRHNGRDLLSEKIIEHISNNQTIHILNAKGECVLNDDKTRPIIFIAASTCFSQIKSLLEFAFTQQFTQPLYFYWGVRNMNDFYLKEIPEQWAEQYANFKFIPVVAEAAPGWSGRQGMVHTCVIEDFATLKNTSVYACGSPRMIYAVLDDFMLHGLDETQFFSDALDYAPRCL